MQMHLTQTMRLSLWLLFGVASLVALFWLMLVAASGFEIWLSESNAAGLSLQGALVLFPISLFFGLRQSNGSPRRTGALFVVGWSIAAAATFFFNVW